MRLQDVINLGRLIGIPQFLGQVGQDFERVANQEIERAKRKITQDDRNRRIDLMTASLSSGNAPGESTGPIEQHRAVKYSVVKKIQDAFQGSLIRRTTASLRYDGTPINSDLTPCIEHIIAVTLPTLEKKLMDRQVAQLTDTARASKSGRVFENHVGFRFVDVTSKC